MGHTHETIINATWVLTLEDTYSDNSNGGLLQDHSIVIDRSKIKDILPTKLANVKYPNAESIDLKNHILMPGLINCHGHAAMSLFRGLADDLPLMTWLNEHIWPAEAKHVSPDFVRAGTKLAISEMLLSGTTCFSDMYFYPEVAADIASELKIRSRFYGPILDFPTQYGSGPDEYIEKILKAHDRFKHHSLIEIGFGPHAPYTVSDEPLSKIRTLAHQLNMPIQIHLHETAFEVDEAIKATAKRPTQRLDELGFLGPDVQAVHVTQANEEDISILGRNGVHVIHCPESNMKLASGFCPVGKLIRANINVALGTDGAASNNDLDMIGEMHTAALLAKCVDNNASTLPAIEAVKLATINGAKAMNIDHSVGSLVPGKQADLIAIDLSGIESQPIYDPISHIAYSATRNQVKYVWVDGYLQVANGELCHINQNDLVQMASQWQLAISSSDNLQSE